MMKCKECEQAMLTHELLNEQERQQIEQHRSQCTACEKFWQETVQMNILMTKAAQPIQAKNPSALTDRIMTAVIREQKSKNTENWLEKAVFGTFTRFALSGVSICLVILFAVEFNATSAADKPKGPVAGLQVILSSQSFRKNFSEARQEKKSLISECTNNDHTLDLSCLKTRLKF